MHKKSTPRLAMPHRLLTIIVSSLLFSILLFSFAMTANASAKKRKPKPKPKPVEKIKLAPKPTPEQKRAAIIKKLAAIQLKPTPESLNKLLAMYSLKSSAQKNVTKLINQLGDPDFRQREAASKQLTQIPSLAKPQLQKASQHTTREIRIRAQIILRQTEQSLSPLEVALNAIHKMKIHGTVPALIQAAPNCRESHVYATLLNALAVTVKKEPVKKEPAQKDQKDLIVLLKKEMKNPHLAIRAAAIFALKNIDPKLCKTEWDTLLKSPCELPGPTGIGIVTALANTGDRLASTVLIKLLHASKLQTRIDASILLRQFTREHFEYAAYSPPKIRLEAIARWNKWLAIKNKTAKIYFPVNIQQERWREHILKGNTLVTYGYRNGATEYNAAGKKVWSSSNKSCFKAERLLDGTTLLTSFTTVSIVNKKGKTIWELPAEKGHYRSAKPLRNGNILVAIYFHKKSFVQEVTRKKKVVWQREMESTCLDIHRLQNGNTIVTNLGTLQVINLQGMPVWTYEIKAAKSVQPLNNGNILIGERLNSHSSRIIEVNKNKEIVWSHLMKYTLSDAYRLPNGNTLVAIDNKNFVEVTPQKKETPISQIKMRSYGGSIRR